MPLAKVTRSSMNVLKLWTTDRGTFPVVLIAGVAATAAAFSATRYLFAHPDVRFDKDRRLSSLHHKADEGAEWRARRFRFANYARNPINQSHQYDALFDKQENQGVRR